MCSCVLVVEHDAYVRQAIGRGLRQAGFQVMLLSDADEAIDLLCLVAFDLVLADVGTLAYAAARDRETGGLRRVLGAGLFLPFTTPATMGPAGAQGALVLAHPSRDLPQLLGAIALLTSGPSPAREGA